MPFKPDMTVHCWTSYIDTGVNGYDTCLTLDETVTKHTTAYIVNNNSHLNIIISYKFFYKEVYLCFINFYCPLTKRMPFEMSIAEWPFTKHDQLSQYRWLCKYK